MSAHQPHPSRGEDDEDENETAMLDPTDAAEEIESDEDAPMDSDDDEDPNNRETLEEIALQNDSVAHFDAHNDSIFCIAQHPVHNEIIATGGGDDCGYILDATPAPGPVLPPSYESNPQPVERASLPALFKLEGHTDSVNAVVFTQPKGQYVATAGLDGRLRVWQGEPAGRRWKFLAEAQEVEEIQWMVACPNPAHPNTLAFGASDGSVWVYKLDAADKASPLTIVQAFYLHTEATTAGAWSQDGKLLATVSEDSSLYVWDVFGDAAAAGVADGPHVVGLTGLDERFRVEGGLYSVAIAPNGAFVAVGGREGQIRIVGLPRLGEEPSGAKGTKSKAGGSKTTATSASSGQAGQILASLQAGEDNVETISFSQPPLTLMAAGNVDGSITLFDTAHRFAIRRSIQGAHEDEAGEQAVVKVEFVNSTGQGGWLLTSAGYDGVVRRWDARGGTAAAAKGLIGEWRGHRGGGEGGGIMGFVQGDGKAVVTAGDDSVVLVFPTPI